MGKEEGHGPPLPHLCTISHYYTFETYIFKQKQTKKKKSYVTHICMCIISMIIDMYLTSFFKIEGPNPRTSTFLNYVVDIFYFTNVIATFINIALMKI